MIGIFHNAHFSFMSSILCAQPFAPAWIRARGTPTHHHFCIVSQLLLQRNSVLFQLLCEPILAV